MSYKDKDMLFDIVDTGEELKPFIHPQQWDEDSEEWVTTSFDEPMPVILKDNDEIFSIANRVVASAVKKFSESRRAVDKLQQLIDESE